MDFGPKTGLSNAKFMYQYDDNFRLISLQGRIGGQTLPEYTLQYNPKTGAKSLMGQFTVSTIIFIFSFRFQTNCLQIIQI